MQIARFASRFAKQKDENCFSRPDLHCNKKTYPLSCRRELKPNSRQKSDKNHNEIEGITACACKWFSASLGRISVARAATRNALSARLGTNGDNEVTCTPESQKIWRQSCGVLLLTKYLLSCIQTWLVVHICDKVKRETSPVLHSLHAYVCQCQQKWISSGWVQVKVHNNGNQWD